MFLPHPRVKVSIVGSLRDREVACPASDRQGSNFESCVWRTVSSQSSHHPQEVLLAQFSIYVHKGGLKPDSFHFSHFKFDINQQTFSRFILYYRFSYYAAFHFCKIYHGLSLCGSLHFVLYAWSSYFALLQNYSNSKWPLDRHFKIACSQMLIRSLTDIAVHICQIKKNLQETVS